MQYPVEPEDLIEHCICRLKQITEPHFDVPSDIIAVCQGVLISLQSALDIIKNR